MSIKNLIVNKQEETRIKIEMSKWKNGKCRYCGQDVKDNSEAVEVFTRGNGRHYAHLYCAEREMMRIKEGLIKNNPLLALLV